MNQRLEREVRKLLWRFSDGRTDASGAYLGVELLPVATNTARSVVSSSPVEVVLDTVTDAIVQEEGDTKRNDFVDLFGSSGK